MKFFLIPLALFLTSIIFIPASAHAATKQPAYTWDGPPCTLGGVQVPTCSIDPPDPDQNFTSPCYYNQNPGNVPNAVAKASIGICQAARQALLVPPDQRIRALNVIEGWSFKLLAAMEADKDGAGIPYFIPDVITDLQNLHGDLIIYESYPTPAHWQAITQDLFHLGVDGGVID